MSWLTRTRDRITNLVVRRRPYTSDSYAFSRGPTHITHDIALQLSTVNACDRLISNTIATLSWPVYQIQPDGTRHRDTKTPIYWLLNVQANPEMTAFVWRRLAVSQAVMLGNHYSEIQRDQQNRPVWLWPLDPGTVIPDRNDSGELIYRVRQGGRETILNREDVLHVKGMGCDGMIGYSMISVASRSLGFAWEMDLYGASFFANGTHLGLVMEHPGKLSPEAKTYLMESVAQKHGGGAKAFRAIVAEEGMKLTKASMTMIDAQFAELAKARALDICFVPGTEVITVAGPRPIESIKAGEFVLTHKGRWRSVKHVMTRDYVGEVVTVSGKGLTPVTATTNHPFYVRSAKPARANSIVAEDHSEWCAAGDLVPTQRKQNGRRSRRRFHNLTMPRIAPIARAVIMDISSWAPKAAVVYDDTILTSATSRASAISRRVPLDYDLGWLCGLFIADGSTGHHQAVFYIGAHEENVTQALQSRLRSVFLAESSTALAESVARTTVSNRILTEFFAQFGHYAHEKKLAPWCMIAPAEFRRGVIAGLVAGDGGTYKRDTYLRTTSKALMWQLRLLLWAEGINSGMEHVDEAVWEINGRGGVSREIWTVRWRENAIRRGTMGVADDHVFFSLDSAERSVYHGPVFNLEVDEDESYTTVGGVAHNCRWFGIPPHKLADLSNAHFANVENLNIEYVQDTIQPLCTNLEQEVDIKLIGYRRQGQTFTRLNIDTLLRGDTAARHNAYTAGRNGGWYSVNDIRRLEGMDPIGPEGDIYLQPLNMVPAGTPPPAQSPPPQDENITNQRLRIAAVYT